MAKTVAVKIPDDIEYRVISNVFGLLIASAGLLAGEMVRQRSFDFWLNDIVPLLLLSWIGFRLYRNFLSTLSAYQDVPASTQQPTPSASPLKSENVIAGQLTALPTQPSSKPSFTAEQAVEEVAKRIEAQKAAALKKSKAN